MKNTDRISGEAAVVARGAGWSSGWMSVLLCCAALGSQAQVVETPIKGDPVTVTEGKVAGKQLASGVKAYLGVRYAAAPVRELRWKAPQPAPAWTGIYNADRKMPECIQALRAHNINHYFGEEPTSEDCLFMNLWVPGSASASSKLPVIVFIYGGGGTIGSSGMAVYDGEQVARSGAIFVNFNYRVGALGFLAHPELTAESPNRSSGNYGHLDQIAALQWVQRNIAKFGGDPAKVIISGQSFGAGSVSLLQASPLAKGLFRGVVAMSGSAWGNGGTDTTRLADAEKIGVAVQSALKAASLDEMRQLPADRVLAVQQDCQLGCSGSIRIGGANVDGYFLPGTPAELFASKRHSDVPVIAGFTRDESNNDLRSAKSVADYQAAAARLYGSKAEEFLKLYPVSDATQLASVSLAAARDAMVGRSARNWALAQSSYSQSPTYIYMLSRVHPFNPAVVIADHPELIGAYHTSDVPYWFQTLEALNLFRPTRVWTDADRQLARRMTASLIAFANTGNPATSDVNWPAWSKQNERLVEFDQTISVLPMNTARMDFQRLNPPAQSTQTAPRAARD